MKKQTIALIAILTALLTACTETTGYNTTLVQADSLMNLHPDSALNMLESISTDSLKTKSRPRLPCTAADTSTGQELHSADG